MQSTEKNHAIDDFNLLNRLEKLRRESQKKKENLKNYSCLPFEDIDGPLNEGLGVKVGLPDDREYLDRE